MLYHCGRTFFIRMTRTTMKHFKLVLVMVALVVSAIGFATLTQSAQALEEAIPTWDVTCEYDREGNKTKEICKTPGSNDHCPRCPWRPQ